MYAAWGTYSHYTGEVALSHTVETLRNEAMNVVALLHRYTVNGLLITRSGSTIAAVQSDINNQAIALKAAYAQQGRDFSLYLDSGSRSTHTLLNSRCLGGTRVVSGPSFEMTRPAAGATFLPFTVVIEGEVPVTNALSMLLAFEESLSQSGGGPLDGHLEPLNGSPIKQRLKAKTVFRVQQQGSAVGYLAYPSVSVIAPPIWPGAEIRPMRQINTRSPRRRGTGGNTGYTEFPVQWSYQFESAAALNGSPHRWSGL